MLSVIAIFTIALNIHLAYKWATESPDNTCVPATLHRIFPDISFRELTRRCNLRENGVYINDMENAWRKLSTNDLVIVYDIYQLEAGDTTNTHLIDFNKSYLWAGIFDGVGHVALIQYSSNMVTFSHSQFYEGTTNYYLTNVDLTNFYRNTLRIYTAPEIDVVRFK